MIMDAVVAQRESDVAQTDGLETATDMIISKILQYNFNVHQTFANI